MFLGPLVIFPCRPRIWKFLLQKKGNLWTFVKVADPGCLPQIPILIFSIPDLATTQRGGEKFSCLILCSHQFHKNENYLIFELLQKNSLANWQTSCLDAIRNMDSGYMGSRIRSGAEKTYPGSGSRCQKRNWIPDPDPCTYLCILRVLSRFQVDNHLLGVLSESLAANSTLQLLNIARHSLFTIIL